MLRFEVGHYGGCRGRIWPLYCSGRVSDSSQTFQFRAVGLDTNLRLLVNNLRFKLRYLVKNLRLAIMEAVEAAEAVFGLSLISIVVVLQRPAISHLHRSNI